jgi:hypothetical protein
MTKGSCFRGMRGVDFEVAVIRPNKKVCRSGLFVYTIQDVRPRIFCRSSRVSVGALWRDPAGNLRRS